MPDRSDQNPIDGDDIIDEPVSDDSVDAAGIDVLGAYTAQVSVVLPTGSDDDLVDDDLQDEIPPHAFEAVRAEYTALETAEGEIIEDAVAEQPSLVEAPPATPVVQTHDEIEVAEPPADADSDGDRPGADHPGVDHPGADLPGVDPSSGATGPSSAAIDAVPALRRSHPATAPVALEAKRAGALDTGRESADLLTADRLLESSRIPAAEPEGVWSHFVYTLSRKRVNLGDGKRARARKELDRRIAVPLDGGARFVAVLSRKGGVGKTTVTALLGMALADARDDRVIAVDANPDRGTLADRVGRPSGKTVRDLSRAKTPIHGFNEVSALVARDQTRLDVLASDADPRISDAFDDEDYRGVADLAAHYYSIVLTDTGTGIVHAVMQATLAAADAVVVVAGLSVDEARLASETLTWLETNGYEELARNAVVAMNRSRPGVPLVREDEIEQHFRSRARAVVRVPYDPTLATGSDIAFRELQPATRESARRLAAVVVEGLGVPAPVA